MRICERAGIGEHRDEADRDAEDVGELAREALVDLAALGRRHGERGAPEGVVHGRECNS